VVESKGYGKKWEKASVASREKKTTRRIHCVKEKEARGVFQGGCETPSSERKKEKS